VGHLSRGLVAVKEWNHTHDKAIPGSSSATVAGPAIFDCPKNVSLPLIKYLPCKAHFISPPHPQYISNAQLISKVQRTVSKFNVFHKRVAIPKYHCKCDILQLDISTTVLLFFPFLHWVYKHTARWCTGAKIKTSIDQIIFRTGIVFFTF
jgi:hypothetical protein